MLGSSLGAAALVARGPAGKVVGLAVAAIPVTSPKLGGAAAAATTTTSAAVAFSSEKMRAAGSGLSSACPTGDKRHKRGPGWRGQAAAGNGVGCPAAAKMLAAIGGLLPQQH